MQAHRRKKDDRYEKITPFSFLPDDSGLHAFVLRAIVNSLLSFFFFFFLFVWLVDSVWFFWFLRTGFLSKDLAVLELAL